MENWNLLKALSVSVALLLIVSCAGLLGPSPEDNRKGCTPHITFQTWENDG